jgi:hypothetical protein
MCTHILVFLSRSASNNTTFLATLLIPLYLGRKVQYILFTGVSQVLSRASSDGDYINVFMAFLSKLTAINRMTFTFLVNVDTPQVAHISTVVWRQDTIAHTSIYFLLAIIRMWTGKRSRYSDWLRAGRSGDRIPVGARFSAPVQAGPGAPPSHLYNGYRVFPGDKERPGCDPDPSPLPVPWSWKCRAIPLLPIWAIQPVQNLNACTRVHFF